MAITSGAALKAAFLEQDPQGYNIDLIDTLVASVGIEGVTSSADELNILDGVTATAAELNLLAGAGAVVASGTQQSSIADMTITYTSNDPSITPNGAVTFADGATPTVDELLEAFVELNAKVNLILDALDAFGITA